MYFAIVILLVNDDWETENVEMSKAERFSNLI